MIESLTFLKLHFRKRYISYIYIARTGVSRNVSQNQTLLQHRRGSSILRKKNENFNILCCTFWNPGTD